MRIAFAGTPDFAAVILNALLQAAPSPGRRSVVAVYTQPDRPAGRGRKLTPSPVKRLATSHGIPIHQPETCRDESVWAGLAAARPDVLVVAAYGLILPPEVLHIPRYGSINVHASLLPRWRGAAPIQRAILAGDAETGVSIMQMDEGLDTGPVLRAAACPIHTKDTAGLLHDRLAKLGAEQLLHALDEIENETAQAIPQDNALATYAKRITKTEGALDWNDTAAALERRVRAFVPWPVAWTTFQGKPLRVWESAVVQEGHDKKDNAPNNPPAPGTITPGTITACGPAGIHIATRAGALRLLTVQRPGTKPLPVGDFLNGLRWAAESKG